MRREHCLNSNTNNTRWPQSAENEIRRTQAAKLRRYLRDVVLPFSPHYRALGINADSIRTLDDLRRIPFTSKTDLLPTPENPARFKDFILAPEKEVLSRRPRTILRALLHGRKQVERELAAEFRPVSMYFTTGRAAEPLPFLLTNHDLENLSTASRRVMEVCGARPEFRMINAFPFAPHLAFWFAYYCSVSFGDRKSVV